MQLIKNYFSSQTQKNTYFLVNLLKEHLFEYYWISKLYFSQKQIEIAHLKVDGHSWFQRWERCSISVVDTSLCTKKVNHSLCKRFGGLHFFNPVPVMRLLEVVRGAETSDATYKTMMEWGKSVGKTCITCKDTPGFVVNRLLVPYIAEAVRLFERG